MTTRFQFSRYVYSQDQKMRRLKKIQKARFIIRAMDIQHRRILIQDVTQVYLVSEQGCDCGQVEQQCIHLIWFRRRNVWEKLRTQCSVCRDYVENEQYKDCLQCYKIFHERCLKEQWKEVCMNCKVGKITKMDKMLLVQTLPEKISQAVIPEIPLRAGENHCWGCGKPNRTKRTCEYCNANPQQGLS